MTKRPIRSASNYSVYKIFIKINLIDFNVDFYTVQKPYDQSLHKNGQKLEQNDHAVSQKMTVPNIKHF